AGRTGRSRAGSQRPAAQALLRRARRLRLDARPRPSPAARRRAVEGRADRHRGANAEDAGGPVPGSDAPLRARVRRFTDPLGGLGGTEAVVKVVLVLATVLLLATSAGAVTPYSQLTKLYSYDASAPLDVQETGVTTEEGIAVHDLSYASPVLGRVPA